MSDSLHPEGHRPILVTGRFVAARNDWNPFTKCDGYLWRCIKIIYIKQQNK